MTHKIIRFIYLFVKTIMLIFFNLDSIHILFSHFIVSPYTLFKFTSIFIEKMIISSNAQQFMDKILNSYPL